MDKFNAPSYRVISTLFLCIAFLSISLAQSAFVVYPYLQNPDSTAMSVIWFSTDSVAAELTYSVDGSGQTLTRLSTPEKATALAYPQWEVSTFFDDVTPPLPYKHQMRLENLMPATKYVYQIIQDADTFAATFKTAPAKNAPIRFIVYGDSETEPESLGKFAKWGSLEGDATRKYVIDQHTGYSNNIDLIKSREPDLVLVAGDLVESGGEQRDWDEFWKHNTNKKGAESLAGNIPLLAALGNHEYFTGPQLEIYNQPGSELAVNKYLSYFENPDNNAANEKQKGRYYSKTYGPVTFIVLDVCNNGINKGEGDTNFYLLGEDDESGGYAPGFGAGTEQNKWLEAALKLAQEKSLFTFVMLHHVPYSVGPHGLPVGETTGYDKQSGQPVRELTPMFIKYGVDAILAGHDEIWERSEVEGKELLSDSSEVDHTLHVYDIGVGGDGLRAPYDGATNEYQKFLAHTNSIEVWDDTTIMEGGKHYGHLEVDVVKEGYNWKAILKPVYILPKRDAITGEYTRYERKTYNDEVVLLKKMPWLFKLVEILNLGARFDESGVVFEWEFKSDVPTFAFEIQRKFDADWDSIAFIEGGGETVSSWFSFTDTSDIAKVRTNKIYYRIKQTDTAGVVRFSNEIVVQDFATESKTLKALSNCCVYPNPFTNRLTFSYTLEQKSHVRIRMYDIYGKQVGELAPVANQVGLQKEEWMVPDNVQGQLFIYKLNIGQQEVLSGLVTR